MKKADSLRKSMFATLIFAIGVMPEFVHGEEVTIDNLIYEIDNGTALVKAPKSSSITTVTIPASVTYNDKSYDVTGVMDSAFYNKTKLTSVTLGENITQLSGSSFYGCTKLATFKMNDKLSVIGEKAFYNCSVLKTVTWSPALTEIGKSAFYKNSALSGILNFGTALKSVAPAAFRQCSKLTGCTVDESNPYLSAKDGVLFNKAGTSLIWYPGGKTGTSYTVPSSVTEIKAEAFRDQTTLTAVTLNPGLQTIEESAFAAVKITEVKIPSSVVAMGYAPFFSCTELSSIIIESGNSVFTVKDNLLIDNKEKMIIQGFGNMPASVTIPEGITKLSEYSFYGKSTLTSVVLPQSLRTIGGWCFYNCTGLKEIVIPDQVNEIGEMALRGCSALTKAHLSANIKTLPRSLFYECENLKNVDLPENLEVIGRMCFQYCHNLQNVKFPKSLKVIELQGFNECYGLTEVILNDGLVELGENAFLKCDSIVTLRVPGTIRIWGSSVFYHLDKLQNVELCEGLKTLGFQSFSWAQALTHIDLPESLEELQQSTFLGCGLKSIDLPENIRVIGDQAFCQSKISTIRIPDKVSYLGSKAFYKCNNLKSFYAGAGLDTIGSYAFRECDSLEFVNLNEGLIDVGLNAFIDCKSLTEIEIPSTVKALHKKCFYGCPLTKVTAKMIKPVGLAAANSNFGTAAGAIYDKCTLYVPEESVEAYQKAAVWKEFSSILPIKSSGISETATDAEPVVTDIFNIHGIRIDSPLPGQINILKMSDGSVRKILLK